MCFRGILWQSSGQDSALSLQRARIRSLVRRLLIRSQAQQGKCSVFFLTLFFFCNNFTKMQFTYHKTHLFKVYTSIAFIIFMKLCLHHYILTSIFIVLKRNPVLIRSHLFPSPLPPNSLSPAAAAAKSLQSCPTLCDPIDGSPPGSPVPGILQARTLGGLPFPSPMHESEK